MWAQLIQRCHEPVLRNRNDLTGSGSNLPSQVPFEKASRDNYRVLVCIQYSTVVQGCGKISSFSEQGPRIRKDYFRSKKTVPGPTRPKSSGYLKLLRNYLTFHEKRLKRCEQESFGKCFVLPFFKINAQFNTPIRVHQLNLTVPYGFGSSLQPAFLQIRSSIDCMCTRDLLPNCRESCTSFTKEYISQYSLTTKIESTVQTHRSQV